MKDRSLARRAFLRGVGGLLVALPALESLGCAPATPARGERAGKASQALEVNKRLIMFFTSFGTSPGTYFPSGGTETSFTLTPQLAPFAPHQKDMLILEEIDLLPFIAKGYDSVGHGAPYCYVVGGWPIFQGDNTPGAGGISLDQKVAQVVGQSTRLRSLPINIGNSNQYLTSTISYTGANQPLAALRDPVAAFNKVFAGFNVDASVLKAIEAERRSVLDFVLDDYRGLSTKVSADDKKLLDFHMQSVRDLETQLANIAASQAACQVPTLDNPPRDPGTWEQGTGPGFMAIAQFQMDLIVTALACDITRVASIAWQGEMNWDSSLVGMDPGMFDVGDAHLASHEDAAAFTKVITWYSKQFSAFIQKLKDKGVFDNALFMWFSENGAGGTPGGHSPHSMPYLLVGNAGGSFRTGRHVKCNHRSPNDLYISIQNAFGVPDTVFGDPAACTGPIAQLA
jgi:Protein of unknown function (DUF1552)